MGVHIYSTCGSDRCVSVYSVVECGCLWCTYVVVYIGQKWIWLYVHVQTWYNFILSILHKNFFMYIHE